MFSADQQVFNSSALLKLFIELCSSLFS